MYTLRYLNVSLFNEHTGKQFFYPTQKLGRDTHPQIGVGVLDEEEHNMEVI